MECSMHIRKLSPHSKIVKLIKKRLKEKIGFVGHELVERLLRNSTGTGNLFHGNCLDSKLFKKLESSGKNFYSVCSNAHSSLG